MTTVEANEANIAVDHSIGEAQREWLMAWGANSYGQLGLGYANEQESAPVKVPLPPGLAGNGQEAIVGSIHGGGGHSFIVSSDLRCLWAAGWNSRGQLGLGHRQSAANAGFQRIPLPFLDLDANQGTLSGGPTTKGTTLVSVACGWDFSLLVLSDGRVFGTGSNTFGQLGLGQECLGVDGFAPVVPLWPDASHVPDVTRAVRVTHVACGLRHTLFLMNDGSVRCCGSNKRGQLGGSLAAVNHYQCAQIEELATETVTALKCGQHFSVALTSKGEIWAFGDNKHGQLGPNEREDGTVKETNKETFGSFRRVALNTIGSHVRDLDCGWTHMAVLLDNGRVHCWGRHDYGQLGRKVDFGPGSATMEKCQALACGSEHVLALDEQGKLFSWGWNEHGNCGHRSTENAKEPLPVKFTTTKEEEAIICVRIFCAASGHSFAVVKGRRQT